MMYIYVFQFYVWNYVVFCCWFKYGVCVIEGDIVLNEDVEDVIICFSEDDEFDIYDDNEVVYVFF